MNHFAYPSAVFLLLLPLIFRYLFPAVKGLHGDALKIPFIADLQKITVKSGGVWGSQLGKKSSTAALWILYLIYILLVLAAARPQWVGEPIPIRSQSRDIMLIMDISNSMLEPDFAVGNRRINRLAAVKKTASDFIDKRTDDRIGLILFGTRAYLQAPLTYDKKSVQDILWSMDAGMAGNSTSIGDAIGLALKNIKEDDHKEKILVLLTDGENNDGSLAMPDAINLAKNENVKVYTIGVGSESAFIDSFFGMKIGIGSTGLDETSLKKLAQDTQGKYFRARDTKSLQQIYNAIDKLEPTENNEQFSVETKELFYIPLLVAVILASLMFLRGQKKW